MPNITILNDTGFFESEEAKSTNRPYLYVTMQIGDNDPIDITQYLIRVPIIDRQKQILPETISDLKIANAIFSVANTSREFSPKAEESFFYNKDYYDAKITVYSGFWTSDTDVSVMSQLVVYLDEVKVDSPEAEAKLICRGIGKKIQRIKIGEPDEEGNADPLVYDGEQSFKTIVEDLLSTHGGLDPSEYSIQDIDITFDTISFTNTTITNAISHLCFASASSFYEDRYGRIVCTRFRARLGGLTTKTITDENFILQAMVSESVEDLLKKVMVNGDTGVYAEEVDEANTKGRTLELTDTYVQTDAIATDIAGRYMERFGAVIPMVEVDIDFMPSLDIEDIVQITDTQSGLLGLEYEVYRVGLDLQEYKGTVYLLKSNYDVPFPFLGSRTTEPSDSYAPEADNWDNASVRDRQFCYLGDRNNPGAEPHFYLGRR